MISWSRFSGVFLMVRRSLRQHALSTVVTAFGAALASGLMMAVFSINAQTYQAFTGGQAGFDAVLGARGSQLQLVLNTVFHLETSPGNIPWNLYLAVKKDPRVKLAVPYAVGDNYFGYRIVGTSLDMFTQFEYQQGRRFQVRSGGRIFDPRAKEAVLGSFVAQKTGLKEGDTFKPYHGLYFDKNMQHEEVYHVAGVLEPTNSPSDRVIWIPIDAFYRMKGHVLRGAGTEYAAREGEDIPDEAKEVSAVMLKFYSPQTGFFLDQTINKQGKVATLAWPIGAVMADLFDKLGWVNRILGLVAYLVVLVAAASILASLYNTISERRRDFAILRSLGAHRGTVFSVIVCESAVIAGLGTLAGFLVYGLILAAASVVIRTQTGVVLETFFFHPILVLAPLGMTGMGALAGLLPAYKAYATDVASNLNPIS